MKYLFKISPWNQQRQFQKPVWVYPAHLAMYATYLKKAGQEVYWDMECKGNPVVIENDYQIDVPFLDLPAPDRVLTDAKNARWQSNGNYKYHPATHMMAALGCTHGKCSFCFEKGRFYQVRKAFYVAEEVKDCVELGFKEIFDDSATFPPNLWMLQFIDALRLIHVKNRIKFGCNLRIDCDNDFSLMSSYGFRMVLFGVESANQRTLDEINKGIKVENIEPVIKAASEAGLEPHITVMFGFPWETHEEAMNTVRLAHRLLKKGYAKTAQASIFSPPRTLPEDKYNASYYVSKVYGIYKSPEFLWRKLSDIREWADIKYLIRSGRLVFKGNLT